MIHNIHIFEVVKVQIGNTTINFINPSTQTKENLKNLYDTCNKIFKDEALFYSKDEIKKLKKDKKNIWL